MRRGSRHQAPGPRRDLTARVFRAWGLRACLGLGPLQKQTALGSYSPFSSLFRLEAQAKVALQGRPLHRHGFRALRNHIVGNLCHFRRSLVLEDMKGEGRTRLSVDFKGLGLDASSERPRSATTERPRKGDLQRDLRYSGQETARNPSPAKGSRMRTASGLGSKIQASSKRLK